MANANLSQITTSNTWIQLVNQTDNVINAVNEFINGNFYKDNGNLYIANGTLFILQTTGNPLQVSGGAAIAGQLTSNGFIDTADATIDGNLTIQGNLILTGTVTNSSNTYVLRYNSPGDGNAAIVVERGAGNGNAELLFNNVAGIWQITGNISTGLQTILTTANLVDNFSSVSKTNAPTSNALNWVFVALNSNVASIGAIANSAATYANGTIVVANTANINWNNTATMNVSITANGNQTNVALNANISAIGGPAFTQANAAFNQANNAYGQANAAFGTANTKMPIAGGNFTGPVAFAPIAGPNPAATIPNGGVLLFSGSGAIQAIFDSIGADFGILANPAPQTWALGSANAITNSLSSVVTYSLSWTPAGDVNIGRNLSVAAGLITTPGIFSNFDVATGIGSAANTVAAQVNSGVQSFRNVLNFTTTPTINAGGSSTGTGGTQTVNFAANTTAIQNALVTQPGFSIVDFLSSALSIGTSFVTVFQFSGLVPGGFYDLEINGGMENLGAGSMSAMRILPGSGSITPLGNSVNLITSPSNPVFATVYNAASGGALTLPGTAFNAQCWRGQFIQPSSATAVWQCAVTSASILLLAGCNARLTRVG